jgi:hypothetical protein
MCIGAGQGMALILEACWGPCGTPAICSRYFFQLFLTDIVYQGCLIRFNAILDLTCPIIGFGACEGRVIANKAG